MVLFLRTPTIPSAIHHVPTSACRIKHVFHLVFLTKTIPAFRRQVPALGVGSLLALCIFLKRLTPSTHSSVPLGFSKYE
jgi:hypothetical protein